MGYTLWLAGARRPSDAMGCFSHRAETAACGSLKPLVAVAHASRRRPNILSQEKGISGVGIHHEGTELGIIGISGKIDVEHAIAHGHRDDDARGVRGS